MSEPMKAATPWDCDLIHCSPQPRQQRPHHNLSLSLPHFTAWVRWAPHAAPALPGESPPHSWWCMVLVCGWLPQSDALRVTLSSRTQPGSFGIC